LNLGNQLAVKEYSQTSIRTLTTKLEMKQTNWFERKFDFNSNDIIFPSLLERLIGTPVRIEEKLKGIPTQFYRVKADNKWSVLEHIGHLTDLEPLWQGRLEDILQGKTELRATDLNNTKTDLANHNARAAEELINEFRAVRKITVNALEALSQEQIYLSALHPRLKTPMRTLDLFFFVAEHDDHHLAKITEINKVLSDSNKPL
jgi:uncharacterized damage-inducible protein DinB